MRRTIASWVGALVITSVSNPRIQWVRELQRKPKARLAQSAFVVEGIRLAEEACRAGFTPMAIFHTADPDRRTADLLRTFGARGTEPQTVSPRVLAACSSTQSPQGPIIVLPIPAPVLPTSLRLAIVADGIADPGNLGALLRTALAAGSDLVLLTSQTVDPYNPKVVRAAMGAHFHLPLAPATIPDARRQLHGLQLWIAEPHRGESIYTLDARQPLALVIGGEARGPSDAWRGPDATSVTIPMAPTAESLNTAAAAAVLMFEIRRQRGIS
jgi:TrmH family RNA methyltransferase